ncbi:hypothetical protein NLI96_g10511 [Meripilus lineatus]|uniref:NAD-dependent epimerase/dehydratase domain-containing protein n=1 Tax=Meripilus lineatus TaxID=2056292 RepID=A0AAD5UV47_9APHY|nr:hypothetical protein NLI96_g10511 [Physisporinus lineatus]
MPVNNLILVTGITGFLGAHVVHQLISAGYRVRGTTRTSKLTVVKEGFAQYGSNFEVATIDDLAHGDYKSALQGVKAVIHAASPFTGSMPPAPALEATIDGALNLLSQAEQSGIRKFVLVSSMATCGRFNEETGNIEISDQIWTSVSKEAALGEPGENDHHLVYTTAKTLAERAAWDFAEAHPHVDFTTGIFLTSFSIPLLPADNPPTLSSNALLYDLLRADGPPLFAPAFLDVRDCAMGIVNALTAPPTSEVGKKRIVLSGEWISGKDVVELLSQVRPELKDRLSKAAFDSAPAPISPVDNTRAQEILKVNIKGWKEAVVDSVDDLLKLEAEWKAKGLIPN